MFFNLVSVVLIILDFMFILAKRLCKPSKLWHKDDTFIWKKIVLILKSLISKYDIMTLRSHIMLSSKIKIS